MIGALISFGAIEKEKAQLYSQNSLIIWFTKAYT